VLIVVNHVVIRVLDWAVVSGEVVRAKGARISGVPVGHDTLDLFEWLRTSIRLTVTAVAGVVLGFFCAGVQRQGRGCTFATDVGHPPLKIIQYEPEPMTAGGASVYKWSEEYEGTHGPHSLTVLYGIVKYRDIFSQDRETRFGYFFTVGGDWERLAKYPRYNMNT
jgi:hypothetical protein